jgi:MFS transporter, DHA1 family, multidrug resistance protein
LGAVVSGALELSSGTCADCHRDRPLAAPMTDTPLTRPAPSSPEFIALIAMMFATIAFAIDAMLPALPLIGQTLSPSDPDRAQLVVTSFVLGMGIGTFFVGPISDAVGRKPVIIGGFALYAIGAALAAMAPSLEWLLAARVIQGLGGAGPRVASMALVRDLYAGPRMAQIMSFAMMVFMIVPAAAPAMGALIQTGFGWQGIFAAFIAFGLIGALWMGLRQPETLAPAARRPLQIARLIAGARVVVTDRVACASVAVQTMILGMLFGTLSSTQAIFEQTFARGDSFPAWFAVIALGSAAASLTNALMVRRLVVLSGAMALLTLTGAWPQGWYFAGYMVWTTGVFAMAGLTMGNLNAIAMEPMGAIAGLAASVILAMPTVLATAIAAPLGLAFDGTPGPLAIGVLACTCLALAIMPLLRR